jgi:hypothetical protein
LLERFAVVGLKLWDLKHQRPIVIGSRRKDAENDVVGLADLILQFWFLSSKSIQHRELPLIGWGIVRDSSADFHPRMACEGCGAEANYHLGIHAMAAQQAHACNASLKTSRRLPIERFGAAHSIQDEFGRRASALDSGMRVDNIVVYATKSENSI